MFSKTSQYTLRALVYILLENSKGRNPGFREIAREIDSPAEFTGKILQDLARKKIVSSAKGKHGGFFLTEAQRQISLRTIIEHIEGENIFQSCGFGLKYCDAANPCPLHEGYATIREQLQQYMNSHTISHLAFQTDGQRIFLKREAL
ncbi:MAG: Rrf2 family transcriptional regulator [Bacteroidales bacterium]